MRIERRWAAVAMLVLSGLGTLLLARPEESTPHAAAPVLQGSAQLTDRPGGQRSAAVEMPQRPAIQETQRDIFAARSWAAPAPASPPVEQAAPAAPPNPYRFAGTALHGGKLKVFLAEGDHVFEAQNGMELANGYRVESVSRDSVVLVYAPLGTQHSIEVSSPLMDPRPGAQRTAGLPGAGAGR